MTGLGGMPVALFGVSAGLGPELALGLADRGAVVALLGDVGEAAAVEQARAMLRTRGHTAAVATFDARDGSSVHDALTQVSDQLGPVRGAVDVDPPGPAATPSPFQSVDKSGWDDRVTVPLRRMLHRFQAIHRALSTSGGRLVVVLPTLSMSGAPGLVPWVTASEGRRAFAKVAARTWGGDGITVNCLGVPALLLANDPAPDQALDRPGLPAPSLGRLPRPEVEVATTVAGLLGDDLGFVTGATLSVDGGVWMTP